MYCFVCDHPEWMHFQLKRVTLDAVVLFSTSCCTVCPAPWPSLTSSIQWTRRVASPTSTSTPRCGSKCSLLSRSRRSVLPPSRWAGLSAWGKEIARLKSIELKCVITFCQNATQLPTHLLFVACFTKPAGKRDTYVVIHRRFPQTSKIILQNCNFTRQLDDNGTSEQRSEDETAIEMVKWRKIKDT